MAKLIIIGNSVDLYQAVTDDTAEQIYQTLLDNGFIKEDE